MGFFRHIKDVMRFMQLPREQRRLTFYSEGKNYWPHLEGLVKEVLATSEIQVCYISSGVDDPGLSLEHTNYLTFKIDEGFVDIPTKPGLGIEVCEARIEEHSEEWNPHPPPQWNLVDGTMAEW